MGTKRAAKKPRLRTDVCKPCWELHYCPYGPLVEHFPLDPSTKSLRTVKERYRRVLRLIAAGRFKTEKDILDAIDIFEFHYPPRWQFIKQYDAAEHACNVFGHICPVFFTWETATETRKGRKHSRYVPRDVMLKVVRRDGQICQICHLTVLE